MEYEKIDEMQVKKTYFFPSSVLSMYKFELN